MLFRNSNSRRAISLLGVLLALSPCIQQSHSICFIAGCGSLFVATGSMTNEGAAEQSESFNNVCSCCQSNANEREESPLSLADRCDNEQNGSCPCPSTCWCFQPPTPLGMPSNTFLSFDLLSECNESLQVSTTTLAECDYRSALNREAGIGVTAESASRRCAKLNRFLI